MTRFAFISDLFPYTTLFRSASTAAITVVSSTCSSALTVSRPFRALTSTPVTPGIRDTASRTEASQPPQLIPVTTYSLVCIIVLLLDFVVLSLILHRNYIPLWGIFQ